MIAVFPIFPGDDPQPSPRKKQEPEQSLIPLWRVLIEHGEAADDDPAENPTAMN